MVRERFALVFESFSLVAALALKLGELCRVLPSLKLELGEDRRLFFLLGAQRVDAALQLLQLFFELELLFEAIVVGFWCLDLVPRRPATRSSHKPALFGLLFQSSGARFARFDRRLLGTCLRRHGLAGCTIWRPLGGSIHQNREFSPRPGVRRG